MRDHVGMPAKQTLDVTILSLGGMRDIMSEMEATFLNSALALFRNVEEYARAEPRANVSMVRAYKPEHFYAAALRPADILHLIGHADSTSLQVGGSKVKVTATEIGRRGRLGTLVLPKVIVSTACRFSSQAWRDGLHDAGVELLIGGTGSVTPANLAAFDMSFYSALLSQIRKGEDTLDRVEKSFELGNAHYRAIHASGTPKVTFELSRL
jgi:hypothetical protein